MMLLRQLLRENRREYHRIIFESIDDFMYRDKRYGNNFAIILFSVEKDNYSKEIYEGLLRQTDKYVNVNNGKLHCFVIDEANDKSYIKVAENIQYSLEKMKKNSFYISAVESEDYHEDYFKMLNDALDFMEFAIDNEVINSVVESEHHLG